MKSGSCRHLHLYPSLKKETGLHWLYNCYTDNCSKSFMWINSCICQATFEVSGVLFPLFHFVYEDAEALRNCHLPKATEPESGRARM